MGEMVTDRTEWPPLLNDEEFEVLEELLAKRRRAREENAILLEVYEEHERRKTTCPEVDLNNLLATLEEQSSLIARLLASAEGLPRRVGWYRDKWQSGCTESDLPWHRAIERWGEGHYKTACGEVGHIPPYEWTKRFRWELRDNPPTPRCEACWKASGGVTLRKKDSAP